MRSDVLQEFFNSLRFSFFAFLLLRQKKSNLQPDIQRDAGSASAMIELPPNEVTWMVKALDQKRRKAGEIKVKLNGVMRL